MKDQRNTDQWLLAGILAALLALVVLVVLAFAQLGALDQELGDRELERTQQLLRQRLDGMFHGFADDLGEEAAAVAAMDSVTTAALLARWGPLLSAQWPVTAIRLADDRGNETALLRGRENLLLRVTKNGAGGAITSALVNGTLMPLDGWDLASDTNYDPREAPWFSKALEEARDQPVWYLKKYDRGVPPLLQLSLLIRGERNTEAYRIIAADVDLSRSPWADLRMPPLRNTGAMLLDGDGDPLPLYTAGRSDTTRTVDLEAVRVWNADKTRWPFSFPAQGAQHRAMVVAYGLNGLTLYTGSTVAMADMAARTAIGRTGVWLFAAMVAVLAFLLIWAWRRRRDADERLRRQAKRSRSQERKLVKALGEREVLNREVHHRVKNNLQVVSSLLNLQSSRLEDGPVRDEFLRGKQRIDTIALVHHKLYSSNDLRNVDLQAFVSGLIEGLSALHKPPGTSVSHEVKTGGLHTDQDTAIELGIIVCELVTNAYQHAFPHATGGHIDIQVQHVEGDLYRLVVRDNGRGLPEGYAQGSWKMGLEIVEAMADQLDGSFHVSANDGVTFEVLFRMQPDKTLPDV